MNGLEEHHPPWIQVWRKRLGFPFRLRGPRAQGRVLNKVRLHELSITYWLNKRKPLPLLTNHTGISPFSFTGIFPNIWPEHLLFNWSKRFSLAFPFSIISHVFLSLKILIKLRLYILIIIIIVPNYYYFFFNLKGRIVYNVEVWILEPDGLNLGMQHGSH